MNLLRLPFLLFLLGGLFTLFLLHDVIQDGLCGHLLFVSKHVPHMNITHMHSVLNDTFLLGLFRGSIGIGVRRALGPSFITMGGGKSALTSTFIYLLSPPPLVCWTEGLSLQAFLLCHYLTQPQPEPMPCLLRWVDVAGLPSAHLCLLCWWRSYLPWGSTWARLTELSPPQTRRWL